MRMKKICYKVQDLMSDKRFGKEPEERTIEELLDSGFVIMDKPPGMSSHRVSGAVAQMFGISKAGHLGTLDPDVSGVLPVILGKVAVAVHYLMKHDKEYIGTARFKQPPTENGITDIFKRFTGEITQTPPVGAAVARRPRKRQIYELMMLEIKGKSVKFKVSCEAGTYVRTLVEDIGKEIKNDAKLAALRRIKVGHYTEDESIKLEELQAAFDDWKKNGKKKQLRSYLHPIEHLAKDLKKVWVLDGAVDAICSGAQLAVPGLAKLENEIAKDDEICIFTLKDELIGFGIALLPSEEMVSNKKGTAVRISRIVMPRGTYPRAWK